MTPGPDLEIHKMSEIVDMPDYHQPYQILTPTSTASPDKMYQWQFDVNTTSTSSPMPQQPAVAHDMMIPYHLEERRSPGPPEPYHGMYGVSAPDQRENPYYNMHSLGQMPPLEQPMNHFVKTDPAPSPPDVPRAMKSPPRKAATTSRSSRRASKSAARKGRADPDDHRNCRGEEVMPKIKPTCPPEERCILESRWNHRSKKGHDMWDSIIKDFETAFNKPGTNKESLQMKFKRARTKYYEWLPEDVDTLRRAFEELEKNRYEILLEKFYELGGSRNMLLHSGDVEFKVVTDLKLEEGFYMDEHRDIGVRRRKKLGARKGRRTNSPFEEEDGPPVNEDHVLAQVDSRHHNNPFGTDITAVQRDLQMQGGLITEQQARHMRNNVSSYSRRR